MWDIHTERRNSAKLINVCQLLTNATWNTKGIHISISTLCFRPSFLHFRFRTTGLVLHFTLFPSSATQEKGLIFSTSLMNPFFQNEHKSLFMDSHLKFNHKISPTFWRTPSLTFFPKVNPRDCRKGCPVLSICSVSQDLKECSCFEISFLYIPEHLKKRATSL